MLTPSAPDIPTILRPRRPGDSIQVRELVESVLAEFGFALGGHDDDHDMGDIAGFYVPPSSIFLVLEVKGEIVGTVGVKQKSDDEAQLRRMYLRPDLRGCGFGKKMLGAALEFAGARGYKRIFLETSEKFEGAIRLYELSGFIPAGKSGGCRHCYLVYEKSLARSLRKRP